MTSVRLPVIAALTLLFGSALFAQDSITAAATSGTAGSTVRVAVFARDVNNTLLDSDAGGPRIQGLAFRVMYDPAKISAIAFTRGGVLQNLTPLYERSVSSSGSLAWIASFEESANPIPFALNAAAPGDRIGTLTVTLVSPLTGGTTIPLTFDTRNTALSNQAGTVLESRHNRQVTLITGSVVVGGSSTTTTLTSSPQPSNFGQTVTFTATVTSAAGAIGGTMTFFDGATPIGYQSVVSGTALLVTSDLNPGAHSITAVYEGDPTHTGSTSNVRSHTVNQPLPTPTGVNAVATSTSSVAVSWNAVAGATSYEIRRSVNNGAYVVAGTSNTTNFTDSGRSANTTYLYVVRALAVDNTSMLSTRDHATTVAFTDDPLAAGVTQIKAAHLTELRTAANALRASVGLSPMTFTDASVAGLTIRQVHVTELRTAISAARSILGLSTSYTDPTLTNQRVKAAHFQELRDAVK